MDTSYAIVRTDLMSGTRQEADLVSLRFYGDDGEVAEVENGVIAKLEGLDEGEREIMKAVAASSSDSLRDCVLIASVEIMYDERKKNLEEFINEAGNAARGYALRSRNIFSVTKEAFVDGIVPELDGTVGVGAGGKLDTSGSDLGTCIDIEVSGRYTYYAIKLGITEN